MKLSSGWSVPAMGLGMWQLRDKQTVEKIVCEAFKTGYRMIDGAAIYENEAYLGEALKKVPRSDLFITSKLWSTCHEPAQVPIAFEKTLRDLQLDYLDLYLIHWPFAFEKTENGNIKYNNEGAAVLKPNVTIEDTWKSMEKLVDSGRVRSIGVSNFTIAHLGRVLEIARIKPAVNQVELHPYLPQNELVQFCKDHGIAVQAYSPLGSGLQPSLLSDPIVAQVAREQGLTPAQVLIGWSLTRGIVPLVRTSHTERLAENLQAKKLDEPSMRKINSIQKRHRFIDPMSYWKRDCFND